MKPRAGPGGSSWEQEDCPRRFSTWRMLLGSDMSAANPQSNGSGREWKQTF